MFFDNLIIKVKIVHKHTDGMQLYVIIDLVVFAFYFKINQNNQRL